MEKKTLALAVLKEQLPIISLKHTRTMTYGLYYEIKIQYDGFEYEFDLDKSGKLLSKDMDRMDRDDMYEDDWNNVYGDDWDDKYYDRGGDD